VVDSDRVQRFNGSGTPLGKWGVFGTGNGQFRLPLGVATDHAGHVFVVDTGNNRVQRFTSSGTYEAQWGTSGSGMGQLSQPASAAVGPDKLVYVTDNNGRVVRYGMTGAYAGDFGSPGTGDGQFQGPFGVVLRSNGDVFVTDSFNERVEWFTTGFPAGAASAGLDPGVTLQVATNPARTSAALHFRVPAAGPAVLAIHDVTGRLMARTEWAALGEGAHEFDWNLTGSGGLRAAPGLYFATVTAAGSEARARFVVVR